MKRFGDAMFTVVLLALTVGAFLGSSALSAYNNGCWVVLGDTSSEMSCTVKNSAANILGTMKWLLLAMTILSIGSFIVEQFSSRGEKSASSIQRFPSASSRIAPAQSDVTAEPREELSVPTDPESPGEWLPERSPTIGTVMLLVGAGGSLAMLLVGAGGGLANDMLHLLVPYLGGLEVLWGSVLVMLTGVVVSLSGRLQRRSRRERGQR